MVAVDSSLEVPSFSEDDDDDDDDDSPLTLDVFDEDVNDLKLKRPLLLLLPKIPLTMLFNLSLVDDVLSVDFEVDDFCNELLPDPDPDPDLVVEIAGTHTSEDPVSRVPKIFCLPEPNCTSGVVWMNPLKTKIASTYLEFLFSSWRFSICGSNGSVSSLLVLL